MTMKQHCDRCDGTDEVDYQVRTHASDKGVPTKDSLTCKDLCKGCLFALNLWLSSPPPRA